MEKTQKAAAPVNCDKTRQHLAAHVFTSQDVNEYKFLWRHWIGNSANKQLIGLDNFLYCDHVNGTVQTFDNFVLRHCHNKTITVLPGEFQYHKCIAQSVPFEVIDPQKLIEESTSNHRALIVSLPFSDTGDKHAMFDLLMTHCENYNIPVCLDIAYWGIGKNIMLDLNKYAMIQEVTCSLSKPFAGLDTYRIGVRFTRNYCNDGVSMINEMGMINKHSISMGMHFMNNFSADWNWQYFGKKYDHIVQQLDLVKTNTVIFALGDENRFANYNRGLAHNYRVCVSNYLEDINED